MKIILVFLILIFVSPFFSAAHYIVGVANNAIDGRNANDLEVVLWNPLNGISDNLTDVIGVNGNSHVDNYYLIDCELLNTPCNIGDNLSMRVFSYPFSEIVNVSVTGAGFDIAPNITLNSIPYFLSILVDDQYLFPVFPENEIDLIANSTQDVLCEGIIEDYDGNKIQNISSEFFDESVSFFGDLDDYNKHYTNNTCFLNESYGNENQSKIVCGFEVLYNANYGQWNCTITLKDNLSAQSTGSDVANINQLLSVGINDYADFGSTDLLKVSSEVVINVTNLGNANINLSLYGYGSIEDDGYAMNCSTGNIPIDYKKYNLTSSTLGDLSLSEFEQNYINLTSSNVVKEFNLNYRQEELFNEAVNSTYWRIYVPSGVSGSCSGNIVMGAAIGSGS